MYNFANDDELKAFLNTAIVNTAEATQILGCTRQNIDDLVRRKKLIPVKIYPRDKLFLRSDVEARLKQTGCFI